MRCRQPMPAASVTWPGFGRGRSTAAAARSNAPAPPILFAWSTTMHSFARTMNLKYAIPGLLHRRGVIKARELDAAGCAADIVRRAEQEAEQIVRTAREKAHTMLEQQRADAERR